MSYDDEDDFDDPDPDEDDDGMVPCPYCGEEMLEDSPRCPSCGQYVSEEDAPPAKHPPWILITAVILLVLALSWAVNRF